VQSTLWRAQTVADKGNLMAVWDVHHTETDEYLYSFRGGNTLTPKTIEKQFNREPSAGVIIDSVTNEQEHPERAPKKRLFKT